MATTEIILSTQALDGSLTPSKISTNPADDFSFPGNVSITDDKKFILGNSGNAFLQYNTDVGGILLTQEIDDISFPTTLQLGSIGAIIISANTKIDGSGTYFPSIGLGRSAPRPNDIYANTGVGGVFSINANGTEDPSALLQIKSTTQGFLPPRMTTAQRDAISSPAAGLIVYNTDTNSPDVYNGTIWTSVGSGSVDWADDVFTAPSTGPNQVFVLSDTPILNSIVVTHNGLVLRPTTDYTLSGTNLTIVENVTIGENIQATYAISNNSGSLVSSINGLTGSITLAAGTNISITPVGNTLTIDAAGSPPAGADTQIQFNSSGSFGASSNLVWTNNVSGGNLVINQADPLGVWSSGYDVMIKSLVGGGGNGGFALALQSSGGPAMDFLDELGNLKAEFNTFGGAGHIPGLQIGSGGTLGTDGFIMFSMGSFSTMGILFDRNANTVFLSDPTQDPNNIADLSAKVEVRSTTQGFLPPRMTTAQRDAISSPAVGLEIFNTDTTIAEKFDGTSWKSIGSVTDAEKIYFGNSGDAYIKYDSNWGGMVLNNNGVGDADLNAIRHFGIWANTAIDGSGTYEPGFLLSSDGTAQLINETTGNQSFIIDMRGVSICSSPAGIVTPDASAALDIRATDRGFLPPRMTTVQKNAISSPATGLVVYDTTLSLLQLYNGSVWTSVGGSSLPTNQQYTAGTPSGTYSGSLTVFDLPFSYTTGGNGLMVFSSGLIMGLGAGNDYTETSTTQITFVSARTAGEVVRFVKFG